MCTLSMGDLRHRQCCHAVVGDGRLQRQDRNALAITPLDPDLELPVRGLRRILVGHMFMVPKLKIEWHLANRRLDSRYVTQLPPGRSSTDS